MRALVVFESMWGNTEEVAWAVARGLGQGADVEVLDVSGPVPEDLTDVQLLVVGGPTHAFSMSRPSTRDDAVTKGAPAGHEGRGIREWLGSLPAAEHVQVATFDTRVGSMRRLPGSAAKGAARQVRRHHLGHLVDEESFYVGDMQGPLLEGELARAQEWGGELLTRAGADH
jgi:hypothetical protein